MTLAMPPADHGQPSSIPPIGGDLLPAAEARPSAAAQRRYTTQLSPWRLADIASSTGVVAVGGIGAIASWYGASEQVRYEDQVGWVYGSVASLCVLGLGLLSFIVTGLRAVRRGQRELWADARFVWQLDDVAVPRSASETAGRRHPAAAATSALAPPRLVTGEGMTRYHRASCPLVHGKQVHPLTERDAAEKQLQRCGVCEP